MMRNVLKNAFESIALISVLGVFALSIITAFEIVLSDMKGLDSRTCVSCPNVVVSTSMDSVKGDTSLGVYVIEDTLRGIVWIGVPGVNQAK